MSTTSIMPLIMISLLTPFWISISNQWSILRIFELVIQSVYHTKDVKANRYQKHEQTKPPESR